MTTHPHSLTSLAWFYLLYFSFVCCLIAIRHDKDEDGDDDNGDDEIADSSESESDNHDEGHVKQSSKCKVKNE